MRRYETIIIADPELSVESREPILQRVKDVITDGKGYLALTDEWGARKLAYEIKKKERGYYIRFDYCGTTAVVDEIERFFRIDDRVMKYMTVLLDKTADVEKIKEEIASAQPKAEGSQQQPRTEETPSPPESAEAAESKASKAQLAATEDPSPTEPGETDKAPSPEPDEPEANESKAVSTDTKEEIK